MSEPELYPVMFSGSLEEERAEWDRLAAQCLARAYSDSEPGYSVDDIRS